MCDNGSDKGYILGSQSLLYRTILLYYLLGLLETCDIVEKDRSLSFLTMRLGKIKRRATTETYLPIKST